METTVTLAELARATEVSWRAKHPDHQLRPMGPPPPPPRNAPPLLTPCTPPAKRPSDIFQGRFSSFLIVFSPFVRKYIDLEVGPG